MKRFLGTMAFAIMTVFLFVSGASAAAILDFNMSAGGNAEATISYAGGDAPLVGADIGVQDVTGIGTPSNNFGVLTISNGELNFTSGDFTSFGEATWDFSGGGSIVLTGGIPSLGIPDGTILFSGVMKNAQVEVAASGGDFKVTIASFYDQKNEDLAAYYGLVGGLDPTDLFWEGSLNLSFVASATTPDAFTSSVVLSGDVTNSPVPEPGTMMLLGSGLIGLAGWGRKKFRK